MDDPALLASVSRIAATGHGMFGFYDEEDGGSEPVRPQGWYAATARTVHIYPACQLPSPGIRFERWTTGPSRQASDSGDDPEVRARLKFQVTQGSIGLTATAMGSQPGVFTLPVGWYHLELLGYRLSVMLAKEKDLYARGVAPGDTEWERAEGIELYVARFWPEDGPAPLNSGDDEDEERQRLETIRAWAKGQGIQVNDEGLVPASVIAQYEAGHP